MTSSEKLYAINAKLNRLKAKKARLDTMNENRSKQERVARTRTLIQMGGLLSIVNIPTWFDIELGDDLQTDINKQDLSMMLLGLLATVAEQLPEIFSEDRKKELKLKGQRFMKEHTKNNTI